MVLISFYGNTLTDNFPNPSVFSESDFRKNMPRFLEPNFSANCKIISSFREFSHSRGWTTSATALAWTLDQGEHIIPIPGTRTAKHLKEWLGAIKIKFSKEDRDEIKRILPVGFAHGDRYSDEQIVGIERYC